MKALRQIFSVLCLLALLGLSSCDFSAKIKGFTDLDYNDFTIKRNTHYTYTITIKGVNSIETEVETGVENQSGAVGDIYKSTEEIYTFDAHYGQRVFRIDATAVRDDIITWYVKTPFSEGMPSYEGSTQIPNLDYKWVWFIVNEKEYNGVYSSNNRRYPGDQNKQLKRR